MTLKKFKVIQPNLLINLIDEQIYNFVNIYILVEYNDESYLSNALTSLILSIRFL